MSTRRKSQHATGRRRRGGRLAVLLGVATIAVAGVAGCGDDSDSGTSGGSGDGPAATSAEASAVLDASFEGIGTPPPDSGPKAQPGKTIWVVGCPAFEGCRMIEDGVKDAAQRIGWTLKSVDGKADPSTGLAQIKSAVAAKADGVITISLDCPVVKTGLLAAKAAKIPVLSFSGLDCDDPAFGGKEEPLFAAPGNFLGVTTWADYYAAQGQRSAAFVSAQIRAKGIEKPEILFPANPQELGKAFSRGALAEFEKSCPDCVITTPPFQISQLAAGKGAQIFKSQMQANPKANVFLYFSDAYVSLGMAQAFQTNQRQFELACCGDGGLAGLEQVRKFPDKWMINATPLDWSGWALVDTLNRLFAGETELPNQGGTSVFVDAEHNLPPDGQYAKSSVDYPAAYAKLWGR